MEFLLGAFQDPFFLVCFCLFGGDVAAVWLKKLSLIRLGCEASSKAPLQLNKSDAVFLQSFGSSQTAAWLPPPTPPPAVEGTNHTTAS